MVALSLTAALWPAVASDFEAAVRDMGAAARAEVEGGHLSGVSIALIAEGRIVMEAGFGEADKRRHRSASPTTVYRVGSISKLFTAVAAMQLAEQGRLDIDAPAAQFVPEFRIVNPFPDASPPTLRQLMCHRSGLVREAPVGGYFDPNEPSATATVASLEGCVLVHPPNTRTKYSNSGVTVVGRAVEHVSGMPFDHYLAERILEPLGMAHSNFRLSARLKTNLARGYLPVALPDDGFEEMVAPQFEFGILPAGNLYSTVGDLGRFLICLFSEAHTSSDTLLSPETLAEMWTVQLTGATNGFGLGFAMGQHRGQRTFGHMGAVYGFTSQLIGIPEHRLGVVVLANDDLAIGPVRRLTRQGLDLLLQAHLGLPRPESTPPDFTAPQSELESCLGDYESESYWARIELGESGSGRLRATVSRQPFDLVPAGNGRYLASGRLADNAEFRFEPGSNGVVERFEALGQRFQRVDPARIPTVPKAWNTYVGAYGPRFIPLRVSLRHGHLYAMTENEYDYRLRPVNRTVFLMPPGLYDSEHLVFQTDRAGRVHGVLLANMPLGRRR